MEAFYLLFSILTTSLTSLALSIPLILRTLLTRYLRPFSTPNNNYPASISLYQGTVWHERRKPVHHSFQYPVRYALFKLDRSLDLVPPGHLSADEARDVTGTNGPVYLLTIPTNVGYEQNPVSLYYCYDLEGSIEHLKKCIAKVTNTPWGESVMFVFNPNSDLMAKPLHVSPFMDMLGSWNIKTNAPGDSLSVSISVQHPELGNYFVATLKVKRISSSVEDHAMFFWLMPHKVALWIYWHALRLWWKNVKFIQHPRYSNPSYREEAVVRDQKLQCSKALESNKNDYLTAEGHHPVNVAIKNCGQRWIKWRDAKWPWC